MINLKKLSDDIKDNNTYIYYNYNKFINKFYTLLEINDCNNVRLIESEWTKHFYLVYGNVKENISSNKKVNINQLIDMYNLQNEIVDVNKLFFSIQTYYACLVKMIAMDLLEENNKRDYLDDVKKFLSEVFEGVYFEKRNILNYCYEDWYNWFFACWDADLDQLFVSLLEILNSQEYKCITDKDLLDIHSYDYMKKIYESIVPREFRHALGEYYTPDWLAEYTIESVVNLYKKNVYNKMIDPTCGSGTFILKAILYLKKNKKNITQEDIMELIKGFDINPLAVLTAKTNYLISTNDCSNKLLPIEIPIYQYDTINVPKVENETILIDMDDKLYRVPLSLLDIKKMDIVTRILKLNLKKGCRDSNIIYRNIIDTHLFDEIEIQQIVKFYDQLIAYKDIKISLIWFNVAVNYLKGFKEREFDLIIGNPPWVNWEYMPIDYRMKSQSLWIEQGIFTATGKDLSFAKEDISTLITYLCMDRLLKNKGILSFVMRQGIFKSEKNGVGFRKFRIRDSVDIKVLKVDDLVAIRPFEGAQNQTAIMYLQKGIKNRYPVPYYEWKKLKSRIKYDDDLKTVLGIIDITELQAMPTITDDPTSLWVTANSNVFKNIKGVLGKNNYQARTGVFTGGANAVYWLDIINITNEGVLVTNITERAKRKVEKVEYDIECKYVYPFLRGKDIKLWDAKPEIYLLCPHTAITRMKPVCESQLKLETPHTLDYFYKFKDTLNERKGFAGWEKEIQKETFYSILRIGDYTFSKYKVVWKYIAKEFITAVISTVNDPFLGEKEILPNEKVMYVSFENKKEAYFLCGILSSQLISDCIKSYMNPTSISTHVLDKLNIPTYDETNPLHSEISMLCEEGHLCNTFEERERYLIQINRLVERIYGIK